MRVFISWSKPRSRAIALALHGWLPLVLQASKPWMSDEIEEGTRSLPTIDRSLATSAYGIVVVTPENQHERWLNFEVGWLASRIEQEDGVGRPVVPLLFDMAIADLRYPMAQFQAVEYGQEKVAGLVRAMNARLAEPLADAVVTEAVAAYLPRLAEAVDAALALDHEPPPAPADSSQDLLREVVAQSRDMVRDLADLRRLVERQAAGRYETMLHRTPSPQAESSILLADGGRVGIGRAQRDALERVEAAIPTDVWWRVAAGADGLLEVQLEEALTGRDLARVMAAVDPGFVRVVFPDAEAG